MIVIKKLNETYLRVDCEPEVAAEISGCFRFYAKAYKYDWKFQKGLWDGKISLFSPSKRLLYAGLLRELQEFLDHRGYLYHLEFDDSETSFSVVEARDFVESLGLPHEVYDFQLSAFIRCVQLQRDISLMPTASGKSLCLYILSRYFKKKKQLIIVPIKNLIHQLEGDFLSYGHHIGGISKIYAGEDKINLENVTISTFQSIINIEDLGGWLSQFDMITVDEVHRASAQSLITIMAAAERCGHRYGFTGTIGSFKADAMVLTGLFGPIKSLVSTKTLMDEGKVASLNIKILELVHSENEVKELRKKVRKAGKRGYFAEIDAIVADQARNKFIKNLALSLKGNTLILFRFLEHGKAIFDLFPTPSNVFYIDGSVDGEDRNNIRQIVEKEEDAIIVASIKTFGTGTNIRRLNNLIAAHPMKGSIDLLQAIGRSLRLGSDKTSAVFYDVADNFIQEGWFNFGMKHKNIRRDIYMKEKFDFKSYKIKM
jgi:superfamily II DNA or RNA helicase